MQCIKCHIHMTHVPIREKYYYDVCNSCSGRWIEGSVLHQHCSGLFSDGSDETFKHFMQLRVDKTDYDCPSCDHMKLSLVVVNQVEIEFCTLCHGVYFDIEEMQSCMPQGNWCKEKWDDSKEDVAESFIDIIWELLDP